MFYTILDKLKTILLHPRVKIALAMLLAFSALSLIQSQKVFLANSPSLNPVFIASLKSLPANTIAFIQHPLAKPHERKVYGALNELAVQPKEGMNFLPYAKGVEAAEDPVTGKKVLKLKKGTKVRILEEPQPDGTVKKRIQVVP